MDSEASVPLERNSSRNIWKIVVGFVALVIILAAAATVFAVPSQIKGNPIEPFKPNQYALSERVTFLLRAPRVGDAVIFTPNGQNAEFVGIVIGISENAQPYAVISGQKEPWHVSRYDISRKIYYPSVSQNDIESLKFSFLATPTPSPSPEEPLPTIAAGSTGTFLISPTARPTPTFSATIDGYLYIDDNNNGVRDSYEKGATGRDIKAWKKLESGHIVESASTITNDDGYFKLRVGGIGSYLVNTTSHSIYYIDSLNRQATIEKTGDSRRVFIPLVPVGKTNPETGSSEGIIQGITFNDSNNNGARDSGENGIRFFKVNLSSSDGSIVQTTTSDDNGSFTFQNLPLTAYNIVAYNPTGQYTITKSSASVTLTSDHTLDNTARLGVIKNY